MMIIKSNRREFVLTEHDRILFNGKVYILMTKKVFDGFDTYNPSLTKSRVEKLIKNGDLVLANEKYKGYAGGEYDLYKIAESER